MKAFERKKKLLNELYFNKVVYVNELAKEFKVSEETIRRDLEKLEKESIVERNYGGAKLLKTEDLPYLVRNTHNKESKLNIAKKIDNYICNDISLFADSSSTVVETLKRFAVSDKKLHVITNAVNALYDLNQSSLEINSTGGKLLKQSYAFIGNQTIEAINKFNPDYAIISCKALNREGVITDSNEDEAYIKQIMMNKAKKTILALDSSKLDKTSLITFGSLSDIDYIVSDNDFDTEFVELFRINSVKIIN
jgi:DeoR/GlpR family transcriptional regulator of sugar metabolism